jgi:hypothetical protein
MKTTVASRNLGLDTECDQLNNGYMRIYSGSVPATSDTALGAQVLLAEGRFGATAFAAASGASKTANALTADASADASGTPSFFRAFKSDGTTVVHQGTAAELGPLSGLVGGDIIAGATVTITGYVIARAEGT